MNMNCNCCKSGVYEFIGYININPKGQVELKPCLFPDTEIKAIGIEICSLCGDVRLKSNKDLLISLKKQIRESIYKIG